MPVLMLPYTGSADDIVSGDDGVPVLDIPSKTCDGIRNQDRAEGVNGGIDEAFEIRVDLCHDFVNFEVLGHARLGVLQLARDEISSRGGFRRVDALERLDVARREFGLFCCFQTRRRGTS